MSAIFLWEATAHIGSRPPRFEVSGSHTIVHTRTHIHTPARTLNLWSARHTDRDLHNTQQTQEANIHAFSGIRTGDPSNQVYADLRLRSHGHLDRQRDIRNPFYLYLCPLRLELWSKTVFAASSNTCGRSPETFVFINSFLNSSRPERTDRRTDRQKPAPSYCRRKRLFSSSLMTISRLHGDHNKRNRKLILAAGLTTGKLLR